LDRDEIKRKLDNLQTYYDIHRDTVILPMIKEYQDMLKQRDLTDFLGDVRE